MTWESLSQAMLYFLMHVNTLKSKQLKRCDLFTESNNADMHTDLSIFDFDLRLTDLPPNVRITWVFGNVDIFEKVHKDISRKVTKARKGTPMYLIYEECGRCPISIIIKSRMNSL